MYLYNNLNFPWRKKMEKLIALINLIPDIVMIASLICAVTPTPKDDQLLGKAYKIIEVLAINLGKAKMPGK
jgi:hypothetical protein